MTTRESAAAYLAALRLVIEGAPKGLEIVLIVGNHVADEFSIFANAGDAAGLIEMAHHLSGGNAVTDHEPPPEGKMQ